MGSIFLSLIQLAFPFLWWKNQKHGDFLGYVGIKPPVLRGQIWVVILMVIILFFIANVNVIEYFDEFSMDQVEIFMGKINLPGDDQMDMSKKMSLGLILVSIVVLSFRTFCSYVFNYGFILKRLVERFGLNLGIGINSFIFAGFGNLMLIPMGISLTSHLLFFMVGFIAGVINGMLCEDFFSGSILPSLGATLMGDIVFLLITNVG